VARQVRTLARAVIAIAAAASAAACGSVAPAASQQTPVSPPAAAAPQPTPAPAPSATHQSAIPRPDHLVVVIFENKDVTSQTATSAPYLSSVAARAARFTNSRAITHPSQPNYLALFSGSTQGVISDRCLSPFHNRPNLGAQLLDAGRSFAGYSEDMPSVGFQGCSHAGYAAKHNPWAHFDNVPAGANQPYSAFPPQFSDLPSVAFVIPNLCHDMHDCTTSVGDQWARTNLGPYLEWATDHRSLLLITYDENDGRPGNKILTMLAGAGVRPGTYPEAVDHYRILRTIEAMFGLPPIGAAAHTPPITDIWQ
jgi:phosphatidylinositol-3-phosphatase